MEKFSPPSCYRDLASLARPGKAIRTSNGDLFSGENDIWGRDMAITAEDLIEIDPNITEEAIIALANLQGTASNLNSGEKPGRIHTEHREIFNNDKLGILPKLGLSAVSGILWQTGWKEYTTYFSSDTTPLFIRTVCTYAKKQPAIMDQEVKKKDGSIDTIKQTVLKAAEYIESTVSNDGLIRIKEHNLAGNQFRYWRDSPNSYRDDNSNLPNICEPMVILDIQELSAEALDNAASLAIDNQDKAKRWHELAITIRESTIKNLWMEDEQYFAYGMDQDKSDNLKQLKIIQSNAGWLLNSDFFDNLKEQDRQKYVTGIIKRLFSDELLTDAGIRCRSKKHMYDRKFQDYHGSWVTWPVESYIIAKGLRRQGFSELADQIEARIISAVNLSGVNYEFFVVDKDSKVLFNPKKARQEGAEPLLLEMKPEDTIAWTVTATSRIKYERGKRLKTERTLDLNLEATKQDPWINSLEQQIIGKIKNFPTYPTEQEIQDYILGHQEPDLYIDREHGLSEGTKDIIKKIGFTVLKQVLTRPFKSCGNNKASANKL